MSAKKAHGHVRKHVSSRKHGGTSKHHPTGHKPAAHGTAHHVHAKAKHHTHAKARGSAVGDLLPVCALEAVAMSLRLAGQPVSDDEVAWLWELSGSREVSIAEALEAAARFGLASVRPASFGHLHERGGEGSVGEPWVMQRAAERDGKSVAYIGTTTGRQLQEGHALILGVDRPGPHAVLATPGGWWSWGELWSPWPSRIEECWAVSWA